MFENSLLESSSSQTPVLTSRHRVIAMLAGLGGFLIAWKLLPIVFFTPNPQTLLWQAQIVGTALSLHTLAVCYTFAAARRLRLNAVGWTAVTLFLSFPALLVFHVFAAVKTGDWKRATVPIAYILEAVLLGGLVVVPLIRTQALGLEELSRRWIIVPSPPPPPPARTAGRPAVTKGARPSLRGPIQFPLVIPDRVMQVVDSDEDVISDPVPGVYVPGGVSWGVPDGVPFSVATGPETVPPPPSNRTAVSKPRQVHRGGQVVAALAISQPKPDYPTLARSARIQGIVKLEAVISTAGTIKDLKLISGHPLLVRAALEAVSRWRYQPTLLNGEPVEVLTEIDVNFRLAE
ncbi:MAG: energy transducer TonB [Terriglobia bacterium]